MTLVPLMACGDNEQQVEQSEVRISKPVSKLPSVTKKKVADKDVVLIPNQFPLEDGKLPKPKKELEKDGNNK